MPRAGLEAIKLEFILRLKINPLAASSQSLCFILSLRQYSSFITLGPGVDMWSALALQSEPDAM